MPLQVLVIDDDEAHAAATAEIVQRLGHEPRIACSGEEGVARLRAEEFDVVVTDLVMRGRSGLDVVVAAADGPPPPGSHIWRKTRSCPWRMHIHSPRSMRNSRSSPRGARPGRRRGASDQATNSPSHTKNTCKKT